MNRILSVVILIASLSACETDFEKSQQEIKQAKLTFQGTLKGFEACVERNEIQMLSGETALTDAIYSACLKQQFGVLYKDKIAADQPPQFSFLSLQLRASIQRQKISNNNSKLRIDLENGKEGTVVVGIFGTIDFLWRHEDQDELVNKVTFEKLGMMIPWPGSRKIVIELGPLATIESKPFQYCENISQKNCYTVSIESSGVYRLPVLSEPKR
jgi:hypothetical protein